MNLLAHAFTARACNDDRYLLGTSLPDLLPMYDRALRINKLITYLENDHHRHALLLAGINEHLRADEKFHASDFFQHGQRLIRIRLQAITGITVKRFFLAHILFEMLLDRYLIKHHEEFLDRYYRIYTPTQCRELAMLAGGCFQIDVSEWEDFFARFLASRFLYSYQDLNSLTMRAARVASRVSRGASFDTETIAAIAATLADAEIELQASIAAFFSPHVAR